MKLIVKDNYDDTEKFDFIFNIPNCNSLSRLRNIAKDYVRENKEDILEYSGKCDDDDITFWDLAQYWEAVGMYKEKDFYYEVESDDIV